MKYLIKSCQGLQYAQCIWTRVPDDLRAPGEIPFTIPPRGVRVGDPKVFFLDRLLIEGLWEV